MRAQIALPDCASQAISEQIFSDWGSALAQLRQRQILQAGRADAARRQKRERGCAWRSKTGAFVY